MKVALGQQPVQFKCCTFVCHSNYQTVIHLPITSLIIITKRERRRVCFLCFHPHAVTALVLGMQQSMRTVRRDTVSDVSPSRLNIMAPQDLTSL